MWHNFIPKAAVLRPYMRCFKNNNSLWGCAQSRGSEEVARLFTTHPTGIRVHCDKGHKTCGLPVNIYPTRVPRSPPRGRWAGPVGRGSVLEGKLQYLVGLFATWSLSGPRVAGP